jgi:hypothetical protein
MSGMVKRIVAAGLVAAGLAACAPATGPAGVPSSTNVNPQTGARGGTGSSH